MLQSKWQHALGMLFVRACVRACVCVCAERNRMRIRGSETVGYNSRGERRVLRVVLSFGAF